jgi:hypothetical protein
MPQLLIYTSGVPGLSSICCSTPARSVSALEFQFLELNCCQIQYPANMPQKTQIAKSDHVINAKYVQAILYTVLARSVTTGSVVTILPRTCHLGRPPPANADATRVLLYQNVFNHYTEMHYYLKNPVDESFSSRLTSKLLVLGPLAFEAVLFMGGGAGADGDGAGAIMIDEVSLNQVLDQTIFLQPDSRTYAFFADIILSTMTAAHEITSKESLPSPAMRLSTAVNLLKKVVNGMRQHSQYNEQQSARWIRCLIQIMIDGCSSPTSQGTKKYFTSLSKLTSHALEVARAGLAYPSAELQWLATTLFNLAVDLYMSSEPVTGTNSHSTVTMEDVTTARYWAAKATEFADVLGGLDETDKGTLAQTLREKCRRCGWDT